VSRPAVEDIYELSPLQAGMLFHCLYAPDAALYFEQVTLTFDARLDRTAFDRAWREVVARNPILRTSFHWDGLEKPVQVVHPEVDVEIRHVELDGAGNMAGRARAIDSWLRDDRRRAFDLRRAPLFRVAALRVGPASWHLVLSFHHALLDGWSLPLLFQEFSSLYEAYVQGREPRLDTRRPYGDYIGWLQQQDLGEAERFWRRTLEGYAGTFPLPEDRSGTAPDSPDQFSDGFLALSSEATASLQAFCRREQVTLNTLVQAAWALVLARYGRVDDVVFGAIVSGRPPQLAGIEAMIGMFINTIAVRIRTPRDQPVGAWLRRVQADQFEARRYEYSPLVQVQGWSGIPRGTPLFETILVFENYPRVPQGVTAGRRSASDARAFERTNYPLCLIAGVAPDLQLRLLHDERRFSGAAVTRLLTHVAGAMESLAADGSVPLGRVSFLTAAERETVLTWSRGDTRADAERCIHDAFADRAAQSPDAIAIVAPGSTMTFGELHRRARAVASRLRAAGVGPEVRVGIAIERSPDQIAALLAVLEAGGAFVPLDLDHPRGRLEYITRDAGVALVLTAGGRASALPGSIATIDVRGSEPPPSVGSTATAAQPENLAYVIYTSGSTGRPKGVMGEHRAAMNRFSWMWRVRPFERGELGAVKTPLGFVDSIWEIFGPLLAGAALALIPEPDARDPVRLRDALARTGATRVVLVPAMLRALLDCGSALGEQLPRLRHWTVSGESLPADLARRFAEQCPAAVLWNLYGSSEVAGDATSFEYAGEGASVPIGRPIDNTRAYVLDHDLRPAPIGLPGELYVAGLNLARGYLRRPDATAERFLPDPFGQAGDRLYRTGDVARWRENGVLEFVGRADTQVKVRGVRIDPGEIESVLREHPDVHDAVVLLRELPSGPALTMYVVPRRWPAPEAADLRAVLARRLPDAMIPTAYVAVPEFPLTPSGKIWRRALPDPDVTSSRTAREAGRQPPQGGTEERVSAAWTAVLGIEHPGRQDGFFESGGHSLLATQLVSRLREEFRVELPLRSVFEAQTIAGIAAAIEQAMGSHASTLAMPAIVPVARGGARRPAARAETR
jgi:amino acid adenylation domain-containing protein